MKKYAAWNLSIYMSVLVVIFTAPLSHGDKAGWSTSASDASIESSLTFLAVPLIKGGKTFDRKQYQNSLVRLINQKSFFEAIGTTKNASEVGADGTLVGEARGKSIDFQIFGTSTGRVLGRFSVSLAGQEKSSEQQLAELTFNHLMATIPYNGFITSTEGKNIEINIGSNQGLKVGSLITVFDFKGDHPVFSTPHSSVGTVKVIKVERKTATANAVNAETNITPYMKLKINRASEKSVLAEAVPPRPTPRPIPSPRPEPTATPVAVVRTTPMPLPTAPPPPNDLQEAIRASEPKAAPKKDRQPRKVSSGLWGKIGTEMFSLNTSAGTNTSTLSERQFQNSLALALVLGGGYSRLNFDLMASHLSNSSNSVTYLIGDLDYQVYTIPTDTIDYLSFAGIYWSIYSVSQNANPTNILVSTNSYSPEFSERIVYKITPKLRVNLIPTLYYPIVSSDAVNGSSQLLSSFGGAFELSLRHYLSNKWALEGGLKTHEFLITSQSGQAINEFGYEIFFQVLFF